MFIVAAYEGELIRVGDRILTVGMQRAPGVVDVTVEGESESVIVSWDRKVEVLPGVMLSVRRDLGCASRIKFMFEAPRDIFVRELRNDSPR